MRRLSRHRRRSVVLGSKSRPAYLLRMASNRPSKSSRATAAPTPPAVSVKWWCMRRVICCRRSSAKSSAPSPWNQVVYFSRMNCFAGHVARHKPKLLKRPSPIPCATQPEGARIRRPTAVPRTGRVGMESASGQPRSSAPRTDADPRGRRRGDAVRCISRKAPQPTFPQRCLRAHRGICMDTSLLWMAHGHHWRRDRGDASTSPQSCHHGALSPPTSTGEALQSYANACVYATGYTAQMPLG